MKRKLTVRGTALRATAGAAFGGDPATWLPKPVDLNGPNRWSVYLWAGEVGVLVDCTVGDLWRNGEASGRLLRWDPALDGVTGPVARAVPCFVGELHLSPEGPDTVALTLDGHYEPPGGAFGALLDAMMLRRVATRTAQQFLAAVASRLSPAATATPVDS